MNNSILHIINGGIGPIIMEIMNDSDKSIALQKGKVLVQAVELDATLDNISKPCRESIQISRTETTDNKVEDNAPSWEEINKINETPLPIATTFIPDDSLNDTQVSTILADVETQIPTHLVDVFTRSKQNNSVRQQVALGRLLVKYGSVLSKNNNDLGKFTLIRHRINTYNEDPVRERLRRTPLTFQSEEEKTLNNMLDAKVIKPSSSEWASAPVLVRKKDG